METIIETGIYNFLLGIAAITNITTTIRADIAYESDSVPYIILALNNGGPKIETQLDEVDLRYLVKCVSTNPSHANTIAQAVHDNFKDSQKAALTLTSGWKTHRVQTIQPVRFTEQIDRVQYYHRGYIIRIRASKGD